MIIGDKSLSQLPANITTEHTRRDAGKYKITIDKLPKPTLRLPRFLFNYAPLYMRMGMFSSLYILALCWFMLIIYPYSLLASLSMGRLSDCLKEPWNYKRTRPTTNHNKAIQSMSRDVVMSVFCIKKLLGINNLSPNYNQNIYIRLDNTITVCDIMQTGTHCTNDFSNVLTTWLL